jgi:hypothetical protein
LYFGLGCGHTPASLFLFTNWQANNSARLAIPQWDYRRYTHRWMLPVATVAAILRSAVGQANKEQAFAQACGR